MSKLRQDSRLLRMNTVLGRDRLLVESISIDETLSGLGNMALTAFSEGSPVDMDALLGQPLVVSVASVSETQRHFHFVAESVTLRSHDPARGHYHYAFRCLPWFWLLARHQDCRIFQDMSVVEIVDMVLNELGMTDFKWMLNSQPPKRSYCVQYRESTFAFFSRLLEEEGIFYFFEHHEDRHVMILGDSELAYGQVSGGSIPLRRLEQGDTEPGISDWQEERRLHLGRVSMTDYNFESPQEKLLIGTSSPSAPSPAKGLELFDYPGRFADRGRGEGLSRIRMEARESASNTASARSNVIGLGAGTRFSLAGHESASGDYVIQSVHHQGNNNWDQDLGGGAFYTQSLRAISTDRPYRPPRSTPRPVIDGPQTAVVVGKSGEEIDVDKYGRIYVQFHWDRRSDADERSSCRIRVSQTWAGNNWGGMVLPRIGMEVVVQFLDGDPDRPLVTGCVVNADSMPPYPLPAHRSRTTFRTSSTPGGGNFNELRFEDSKGKEQVFLRAARDLHVRVQNQERSLIGESSHSRVEKDSFKSVGGNQNLIVEGDAVWQFDESRSIKVASDEEVEIGQNLMMKAGNDVVIDAGTRLTLRAGGSWVVIDGSGVAASGPLIRLNSGGSPNGRRASPDEPDKQENPVDARGGDLAKTKGRDIVVAPVELRPVRQIEAFRNAAANATPFIQQCLVEDG